MQLIPNIFSHIPDQVRQRNRDKVDKKANFCQRVAQHQRDIRNRQASNGFYAHIKKNEGHTIDWDRAVFLDKEKHWRGRKIKEAIFINEQNPTKEVNLEKVMNLEKGFALDPIWGDFNAEIRGIISKKMGKVF